MNEIVLYGCDSRSLADYLKSLGILRIIAEQADETACGLWREDKFVLQTKLDATALREFFLSRYVPSPIISPWSGRTGFLEGGGGDDSTRKGPATLRKVAASSSGRFSAYRKVIESTQNVPVIRELDAVRVQIKSLEQEKKYRDLSHEEKDRLTMAKKRQRILKDNLLTSLRAQLEDGFLPWIDACFVLAQSERTETPLLGSGGNEGSMDFSINHIGYLLELIDPETSAPTPLSLNLIDHALFDTANALAETSSIGLLSTTSAYGPNMSNGFTGGANENLWSCVLSLEGALLFAGAATKRLESSQFASLSFPFTVNPTSAGHGSIAEKEKTKPELWLPKWKKPFTANEVKALFAEGRSTLGRHQVRNGLDMIYALSSLGVDRGISSFERYGFYERRGQGYYVATRIGEHQVFDAPVDGWIYKDLHQGHWLDRFRRFAADDNVAKRFSLRRRLLEDMLFELAGREPSCAEAQSLLILLGEIQLGLAKSKKAQEVVEPVPRLSERWVTAANDGSPSFRIAAAIAGLRGLSEHPLPLRAQLFPVQRRANRWVTPETSEAVRICTKWSVDPVRGLIDLLEHRLWIAEKLEFPDKPLTSPAGASLDDVAGFLANDQMDNRIQALLLGLSLCDIPQDADQTRDKGTLTSGFGLLKLALTPDSTLHALRALPPSDRLTVPHEAIALLKAGNRNNKAVATAWHRLRASNLSSVFSIESLPELAGIEPRRVAAALLIPLRFGALGAISRSLLNSAEVADQADVQN